MALDFGGFSYIGSGIQDIFAAGGLKQDAASLDKAAAMEDVNAKLTEASTDIQHAAAERDIYKVLGGQASDIAAAGFTMSGTALDLARDSARQGAITQSLIEVQGNIDTQTHLIQAQNLRAQAASARSAANASMFGGIMNIGLGVLSLFMSDIRVKQNVKPLGKGKNGHNLYEFTYRADPSHTRYIGYVAQEIAQVEPDMVTDMGLLMIDAEYAAVRAE